MTTDVLAALPLVVMPEIIQPLDNQLTSSLIQIYVSVLRTFGACPENWCYRRLAALPLVVT